MRCLSRYAPRLLRVRSRTLPGLARVVRRGRVPVPGVAMLRKLGYRRDAVANGLELIDAPRRQACDIILMDLRLTETDGREAHRRFARARLA